MHYAHRFRYEKEKFPTACKRQMDGCEMLATEKSKMLSLITRLLLNILFCLLPIRISHVVHVTHSIFQYVCEMMSSCF